jgi:hypothetical protein
MSRLVSRILLSILMFPLAAVGYIFVFVLSQDMIRRNTGHYSVEVYVFGVSTFVTWIIVAVYWCLLWKSSVKWNSDRVVFTFVAAIVAVIVATIAGLGAGAVLSNSVRDGITTFLGGILAIVLWLIATVLIWRETPANAHCALPIPPPLPSLAPTAATT